jgi:hypothetical protein
VLPALPFARRRGYDAAEILLDFIDTKSGVEHDENA